METKTEETKTEETKIEETKTKNVRIQTGSSLEELENPMTYEDRGFAELERTGASGIDRTGRPETLVENVNISESSLANRNYDGVSGVDTERFINHRKFGRINKVYNTEQILSGSVSRAPVRSISTPKDLSLVDTEDDEANLTGEEILEKSIEKYEKDLEEMKQTVMRARDIKEGRNDLIYLVETNKTPGVRATSQDILQMMHDIYKSYESLALQTDTDLNLNLVYNDWTVFLYRLGFTMEATTLVGNAFIGFLDQHKRQNFRKWFTPEKVDEVLSGKIEPTHLGYSEEGTLIKVRHQKYRDWYPKGFTEEQSWEVVTFARPKFDPKQIVFVNKDETAVIKVNNIKEEIGEAREIIKEIDGDEKQLLEEKEGSEEPQEPEEDFDQVWNILIPKKQMLTKENVESVEDLKNILTGRERQQSFIPGTSNRRTERKKQVTTSGSYELDSVLDTARELADSYTLDTPYKLQDFFNLITFIRQDPHSEEMIERWRYSPGVRIGKLSFEDFMRKIKYWHTCHVIKAYHNKEDMMSLADVSMFITLFLHGDEAIKISYLKAIRNRSYTNRGDINVGIIIAAVKFGYEGIELVPELIRDCIQLVYEVMNAIEMKTGEKYFDLMIRSINLVISIMKAPFTSITRHRLIAANTVRWWEGERYELENTAVEFF